MATTALDLKQEWSLKNKSRSFDMAFVDLTETRTFDGLRALVREPHQLNLFLGLSHRTIAELRPFVFTERQYQNMN